MSNNLSGKCDFAFISALRKLCNHPALVKMQEEDESVDVLSAVTESVCSHLGYTHE